MDVRGHECGQALAEFALVMPFLALMTLGTIEVAMYLQQQSNLNATAFMAARSGSVLGGNLPQVKTALTSYVDNSPSWVGAAVGQMKGSNETYSLVAGTDRFSGLISGLTSGDVKNFDSMGAAATLPLEYDPKKFNNAKTGPKSRFLFDYRVESTEKLLTPAAVAGARKGIQAVKDAVKSTLASIPTFVNEPPKPPKPVAPTPKPKPGEPVTPVPKPVITPPPPTIKLPDIKALNALDTSGEAFETRGAVVSNPHDHGKANSNSFSSLFYLGANFETKGDKKAAWTTGTIAKNLGTAIDNVSSDGGDLQSTCIAINEFIKVAESTVAFKPYGVALKAKVKPWASALTTGLQKEYDARATIEKGLFK